MPASKRIGTMNDGIKAPEQGGEDLLAFEIADEALEAAAEKVKAGFHLDRVSYRQRPGRVLRLIATLPHRTSSGRSDDSVTR